MAMAVAALLALLSCGVADAQTVRVEGGLIRGETLGDSSEIFRAIPYAAPPLGNLRWKPPAPVVPWKGVRDALKNSRPCTQRDEGWNAADAASASEDCLYLAVHTPQLKRGARFPVYVWIHGGSNRAGSGFGAVESPLYKQGIVLVEVEYRLGLFGFLASPKLSAEDPHHSSGNYALMDQIAALQWVHENIARFGGDPQNITIGGQSAGGVDVGQLLRSPLSKSLFQRAIEESGAPALPRTRAQNERIGSNLLALLRLPATAQGLAKLRNLPAKALLNAGTKLVGPDGQFDSLWIASSADNWVLPGNANDIYTAASPTQIPLLIGNLTQEVIVPAVAAREIIENMFRTNAEQALALYGYKNGAPPPDDPVLGSVGTQVVTDLAFRCGANQMARWQDPNHTWRYQFGIAAPGMDHVQHNAELDYVFKGPPAEATHVVWPPLQQYWGNFIKTGDPNGPGLPLWPALGSTATYMAFTPTGQKVGHDLRGPICRLMNTSARLRR